MTAGAKLPSLQTNPSGLVTKKYQRPSCRVIGLLQPWLLDTVPVQPAGPQVVAMVQRFSASPPA